MEYQENVSGAASAFNILKFSRFAPPCIRLPAAVDFVVEFSFIPKIYHRRLILSNQLSIVAKRAKSSDEDVDQENIAGKFIVETTASPPEVIGSTSIGAASGGDGED